MNTLKNKHIYLSENKKISGVLGGIAEYLEVDPTLVRLGFIITLVVTGFLPFVLFYIIAAIIMPKKPGTEKVEKMNKKKETVEAKESEETEDIKNGE